MLPVGYLPCTQDPPSGANMGRVIDDIVAEAQAAATAIITFLKSNRATK